MKNIYCILTNVEYEATGILLAVFSTRKKAQKYVNSMRDTMNKRDESIYIEKWVLDEKTKSKGNMGEQA